MVIQDGRRNDGKERGIKMANKTTNKQRKKNAYKANERSYETKN